MELPLRVLDVGTSSNQSNIQLLESTDLEGQYVALSHRWPIDSSKHFMTTRSSLEQRKSRICLDEMPETFRDAVKVTRELGLRFLWIDSLCIIQDDSEDWVRQSLFMGQIYHNATITVMAAMVPIAPEDSAQTHSEGFLHRQLPAFVPVITMPYYSEDRILNGEWFINAKDPFHSHMELLTRGWVMQEEMLSRRRIIYTADQLFWVCTAPTHICRSQIMLRFASIAPQ